LLAAQNIITSVGYSSPASVSAAPGQVITLFVDGVGKSLTQPVRSPDGSSKTLAGISVTLRQFNEQVVPIIEVRPLSTCPAGRLPESKPSCATLAAITVQIPYELVPLCPLCLRPIAFPPPWLYVTENGQTGEQLTVWAVGLGYTDPPAVTGQLAHQARPVTARLDIDYSFRANALPVRPQPTVNILIFPNPSAVYAALAQGFVGLYQINFIPPVVPLDVPPYAPLGASAQGANAVQSNLTVSFGGGFSFDGAGICVAAPKP
jgi:hypothetical protein